jgi:cobalamin biosynthesis Mg chelatase CobN
VRRLLEAHDRGYWNPDEEVLERLRDIMQTREDELEVK